MSLLVLILQTSLSFFISCQTDVGILFSPRSAVLAVPVAVAINVRIFFFLQASELPVAVAITINVGFSSPPRAAGLDVAVILFYRARQDYRHCRRQKPLQNLFGCLRRGLEMMFRFKISTVLSSNNKSAIERDGGISLDRPGRQGGKRAAYPRVRH
jgi:hypothetical protein